MTKRTKFTRLPDGNWGVRIEGDEASDLSGQVVSVLKRDGSTTNTRLGEVVGRSEFYSKRWRRTVPITTYALASK